MTLWIHATHDLLLMEVFHNLDWPFPDIVTLGMVRLGIAGGIILLGME